MSQTWWPDNGPGGPLRRETHYDGRSMLCFAERPATLAAMFDDLVARCPERPAVVEGRTLSYRELDEVARTVAANLASLGISQGERVALFLGNCWEFIATVAACARLGAVVVPIGTRQRRAELEFLLNNCGAKLLIAEDDLLEHLPARAALPELRHVVALRHAADGVRAFTDLMTPAATPAPVPRIAEEDVAVILYTSGTTGRPKGAMLTHFGIIHSSLTFARCHGLSERDRAIVAVPLSHVTGLVGVALSTMVVGGCVVLMRQAYRTADFLALASRERITYSILVPTIYTLCAMAPDLDSYDLTAWRIGCFGGAPMPIPTIEALAHRLPGLDLLNAYGATETTSPTSVMPRAAWHDHLDSVGVAGPCAEIRVVDDAGHEVPPGEPGELLIAGPMVVPGYWQRPDANASEFIDGYWRSGDIGSVDACGFVRVFDRKKDMINRGGFKIFSAEVENTICGIDGVQECAIFGRPDPVLGERVCAVIVVNDANALSGDAVQAYCAERLSNYKVPETITIRTEPLPRNANGKIQKALLREG